METKYDEFDLEQIRILKTSKWIHHVGDVGLTKNNKIQRKRNTEYIIINSLIK